MLSLKRKPDAYLVNTGCFATAERLRYRSALGYPVNGSGELIYEAGSKALGRAQFHPDPFKYIVSIEIKIQGRVSRESAVSERGRAEPQTKSCGSAIFLSPAKPNNPLIEPSGTLVSVLSGLAGSPKAERRDLTASVGQRPTRLLGKGSGVRALEAKSLSNRC
jgi:hypothetical protein